MATNLDGAGQAQKIVVRCTCGKQVVALPKHTGKRVKCPDCGRAVIVPTMSSPQSVAVASQTEDPPKSTSKARYIVAAVGGLITLQGCIFKLIEPSLFATIAMVVGMVVVIAGLHVEIHAAIRQTLNNLCVYCERASTIAIWSFVGVIALVCVVFLTWYSHSLNLAANAALIAAANEDRARAERAEQAKQQRLPEDIKFGNSQVASLVKEVVAALNAGDIETSRQKIEKALAVPYADDVAEAQELSEQIKNATDPVRVQEALMRVWDKVFERLKNDGTCPPEMLGEFDALNLRVAELAIKQVDKVTEARKARRTRLLKEYEDMELDRKSQLERAQELNFDGLVLLQDTVRHGRKSGEITGIVENRRGKKLRYAKITFNLYDTSGSLVGNALAVVEGLEPDDKWRFTALSFVTDFYKYKISELTGN